MLHKFIKFSSVGGFMTLLGLSLNTFFLKFLQTPLTITYISVYAFNIGLSYVLNSKFTFKASLSLSRMLKYYRTYLLSLALGVILLKVFRELLPFENWILPFLVVPFTMTFNFVFTSRFLDVNKDQD